MSQLQVFSHKFGIHLFFQIRFLYEKGQGVSQDYKKAIEWYQKAADKGNASGMKNIGDLYYDGQGVSRLPEGNGMVSKSC